VEPAAGGCVRAHAARSISLLDHEGAPLSDAGSCAAFVLADVCDQYLETVPQVRGRCIEQVVSMAHQEIGHVVEVPEQGCRILSPGTSSIRS
jgi:hypothetical protein